MQVCSQSVDKINFICKQQNIGKFLLIIFLKLKAIIYLLELFFIPLSKKLYFF